jgi:hypothetical protein
LTESRDAAADALGQLAVRHMAAAGNDFRFARPCAQVQMFSGCTREPNSSSSP